MPFKPGPFVSLLGFVALAGAEDCVDDETWAHKNRGEAYGCGWVAERPATRCDVKGVSGAADGTVLALDACKTACGRCTDSLNCIAAGGYPLWIVDDLLCKFPCGDAWTDCPIGGTGPSPPCPSNNPEASYAVPSSSCLEKCQNYIGPFCDQYGWPSACTSEVDGPYLNLAARCFVLGGEPKTSEELKPCYRVYAPVCGDNGRTYSNDCVAEAAGVTEFSEGACA
mmetsp:Transcript_2955/g.8652  ORF Transcript_2955/g.8652 Transcript_2955/m.8652 type:complete len:225 (-) Transcript_2955:64-738(-)